MPLLMQYAGIQIDNKKALVLRELFAGVPGLEPRMDEPESPVLPITPYPNWQASRLLEPFRLSYPRPDLNRCWRRERA